MGGAHPQKKPGWATTPLHFSDLGPGIQHLIPKGWMNSSSLALLRPQQGAGKAQSFRGVGGAKGRRRGGGCQGWRQAHPRSWHRRS